MSAIFLSYRRDDSSGYAGRLFDNLSERFGRERVFMDIETLEPGMDFVAGIDRAIESCGAVIVMIGPNWIRARDREGRNRLDDPNDFIRLEIVAALTRGVRVIPVLVHNASMPLEQELPESLRPLCRLQAYEIADNRWEFDVSRLADLLGPLIAEPDDEPSTGHAATTERGTASEADNDSGTSGSGHAPGRLTAVAVLLVAALAGGAWWFTRTPPAAPDPTPPVYEAAATSADTAVREEPPDPPPGPTEMRTDQAVTAGPADPAPPAAVDLPPAMESPPAAPPARHGPSAEELRQREIDELLRRVEEDIAALRLTRPPGNNALERLQRVLELDPHNHGAREGLNLISERYRGLTEGALQRGAPEDAQRHLEAAETVDPGADWLPPMRHAIDEQRRGLARARTGLQPGPAARRDPAQIEACLSDCERDQAACRTEIGVEIQSECMQENRESCNQRYDDCISDGSKMYMGQVALESECAGVHIMCEKSLAEACASAAETAQARCQAGFDRCAQGCDTAR